MAAPGSYTEVSTAPPSSGAPTDTGQACMAMLTERGPTVPTLILGEDQAATIFGADTSYTNAFTDLQGFFRFGGRRVWVKRLTGLTPVKASITLAGASSVPSLTFTAKEYGAFANDYQMSVIAGPASSIKLVLASGLGAFPTLTSDAIATKLDALNYTGFSAYGTITSAGAAAIPVVAAAAALTGGTDDNASLTDPIRAAGLLELTNRGPSQFMLPGDSRSAAAILLEAAVVANPTRGIGLIDAPDDTSSGTVAAAAAAAGDLPHVAMYGPWVTVPALVPGGAARSLPPSVAVAGKMAYQDRVTGNPNRPAAGDRGILGSWAVAAKATWTATERDTLNTAGVNVLFDLYGNGAVRIYGLRTLANPTTQLDYLQAANVRLDGAVLGTGKAICDRYVFEQFDGKGVTATNLANQLTKMLSGYAGIGALYALLDPISGQTLDPGYLVDMPVLTVVSGIASVVAPIRIRRSPGAELVTLRLIIYSTDEAFA